MHFIFHCYVHVCCVIVLHNDKYGVYGVWQHCSVCNAIFVDLQITRTVHELPGCMLKGINLHVNQITIKKTILQSPTGTGYHSLDSPIGR